MARILILSFTYLPNKDGIAHASAALAEGLAQRGHGVTVAAEYLSGRAASLPGDNPQVHQFKIGGSPKLGAGFTGEVEEYREFLHAFDGDFIFCAGWGYSCTELAIPEFRRLNARKIIISHGFFYHRMDWYRKFAWGLGVWLRQLPYALGLPVRLRQFDAAVFLSKRHDFSHFPDHWAAVKTGYKPIYVIPNCVRLSKDAATLPDFRAAHGIGRDFLLVCVANYARRKNQLLALRAFRKARLPDATLVFIGSEINDYARGVQEADREMARDFPEGRVLLLEKQDRAATEAALRAMDAFILSAKQEAQPIAVLEALACGKPSISTDTGCVRELGGVVVADSEEEMTEKIRLLAADAELRTRLGKEALSDYESHYQPDAMLDAYETLMREMSPR